MQAYSEQNLIQLLDADKFLPILDADKSSASKVIIKGPLIIVLKKPK